MWHALAVLTGKSVRTPETNEVIKIRKLPDPSSTVAAFGWDEKLVLLEEGVELQAIVILTASPVGLRMPEDRIFKVRIIETPTSGKQCFLSLRMNGNADLTIPLREFRGWELEVLQNTTGAT